MVKEVLARKLWKLEVSEYLVLLMVLIYSVVFSHYSIMKHYSFRSYAWDLGILLQSIASATKGRIFTNNVEMYYSPSYFGVHFSPILFTIVPFFYLLPKVETIFVIQSLILSLSAISLYFLAKHLLKDRYAALLFSAAYLLNPSLQGVNWYHFPPQTFLPLLFLSATYFLKKRRMIPFLVFILLALMTVEQTSYLVLLYGIYVAWEVRDEFRRMLHSRKPSISSLIPFITIAIAISWAIIAGNTMYIFNPNPLPELKVMGNFENLDIKDLSEIPSKFVTNPNLVLKAIRYDFLEKLLYILLTFTPSGFLALLSPLAILPALSWLLLSILSNHAPYYQLGFHYPAQTLPFIMIATIEAMRKLPRHLDIRSTKSVYRKLSMMLLILGVILSIFTSPLSSIYTTGGFKYFRDYGISNPSSLNNNIMELLNTIPEDELILTTPTIFPYISSYIHAYVIPPINAPSPRVFEGHFRYLQSIKYGYIFYTYFWDKKEADLIYHNFIKGKGTYGLFVKAPGLELYKKGYEGSPKKLPIRISHKELFLEDSVAVDDPSSESGKAIMLEASPKEDKFSWYGPYITLTPGNYTANFRMKMDNLPEGKVIRLDVWSNSLPQRERMASYYVYGKDFIKPFAWHTFSIPFNVTERTAEVEFRGLEAASNVTIWLDYVEVTLK